MMTIDEYCEKILQEYPEYISSDQMYRICHICKRTCRYLLKEKLVPNIDSGKKTRRYKIKTADVVSFLKDRERHPMRYKVPASVHNAYRKPKPNYPYGRPLSGNDISMIRSFFERKLRSYPDVLTVSQVAEITGYCKNTVVNWCSKKQLKAFLIRQKYQVPKMYLLDFFVTTNFMMISVKSQKHIAYNEQLQTMLDEASKQKNHRRG